MAGGPRLNNTSYQPSESEETMCLARYIELVLIGFQRNECVGNFYKCDFFPALFARLQFIVRKSFITFFNMRIFLKEKVLADLGPVHLGNGLFAGVDPIGRSRFSMNWPMFRMNLMLVGSMTDCY